MSEPPNKPAVLAVPAPVEKPSPPERRASIRYPFTAAAEVLDLRSKTRVAGRCSDLSLGGCYVDTLSPLAVGSNVTVRIHRELREFEAAATVSYAHVSMGMGLAFTEVAPEQQTVLRTWIAELSGEELSEPGGPGSEPPGPPTPLDNVRQALNELINLMVRKRVLTEKEAAGLLRQIFR